MKLGKKLKNINKASFDEQNSATIDYLQQEIGRLKLELEKSLENEHKTKNLYKEHSNCDKKLSDYQEKVCILEEENKILRKEINELNKIENSDWLLSSDSDDQETISALIKEKREFERVLKDLNKTLKEKDEKISEFENKIIELNRDKERNQEYLKQIDLETEDLKKKSGAYQDLSVLLSKQNSYLISELGKNKELCYDYLPDFSSISSTESSKCEIHKIIEEKDSKVTNLLDGIKIAEENLQKMKEKYFNDIGKYRKQVAKLKNDLNISKAENIRENTEAMKVLDDLKQEKIKLLAIIDNFNDCGDNKKVQELKELNNMLIESLKIKGQQVSDLQNHFQIFLNDKGYSPDLIKKLNSKTQKLKNLRNEFFKIKSFLLKFHQFRQKMENMSISDCIISILSEFQPYTKKKPLMQDLERLNFSSS